jgi:amino acid transporter
MMNTEGNNGNKPLGLWNVVSIGIGAMVGAGIFALLGQAALLMEASTWVAFAFGGIVAMFSGYAYARLGASYPSNGGIIDFFRRGLGNGRGHMRVGDSSWPVSASEDLGAGTHVEVIAIEGITLHIRAVSS